ncbi:MAG TPA: thioesterase family protein [Candidatus Kapabacteria bacterium]|nr:thioesterase family protein [Candidatus Kapabacteria bacterium]
MISHTTRLRVRYADTDQMGIVYYAKYLEYFEVARTELLRELGLPYRTLEEEGFALPVADASIKYFKGATYDDELLVTATIAPKNSPRLEILYSITRSGDSAPIAEGSTTLVFTDKENGKPIRPPAKYLQAVNIRG